MHPPDNPGHSAPDGPAHSAPGQPEAEPPAGTTRRQFLIHAATLTTGFAAAPYVHGAEPPVRMPGAAAVSPLSTAHVRLIVNGSTYELDLDPRVTLLDALREHMQLTGTKKGCDRGQCGACTVLVNGRRINSCLTLALAHDGDEVRTVEGLGTTGALHPVQKAFVEHDAYQCGYCTPGQICSAVALIAEARAGAASAATADVRAAAPVALTDDEIRERMSGNICRCGAYVNIVAAIRDASKTA